MSDLKISALPSATLPLAGTEVLPIVQGGVTTKVAVSDLTAGRAVTAASVNKVAITAPATASTLTIADGKTLAVNDNATLGTGGLTLGNSGGFTAAASKVLTASNTLTLAGTDATTHTFPTTSATIARTDAAQTFTGDQTLSGNLIQGTAAKGFNFTANTPAAGMTSQLFKWYEEGTWNPDLTFATPGDLSVAYSTQVGTYTRVGNRVFINCGLVLTAFSYTTASGSLRVTGLPYTSRNLAGDQSYGSISFQGITKAGYTQIAPNIGVNSAIVIFACSGSGVSPANVVVADVPTLSSVGLRFSITYEV